MHLVKKPDDAFMKTETTRCTKEPYAFHAIVQVKKVFLKKRLNTVLVTPSLCHDNKHLFLIEREAAQEKKRFLSIR